MNNPEQLLQHHAFIATTDRKSLYTHLKKLVQKAQQVAKNELQQRRNNLKLLLEHEDKIYEEEFANTVKARIEKGIRDRRDNLFKIKEESTKSELEFLKSKRIQQYMNSCYEIREALRRKDTFYVQECQLEQILDKERTMKKEKDLEKYWLQVQGVNLKFMDECQMQEDCLKKALVKQVADVRQIQLEEKKEKLEEHNLEKQQEKLRIDALLEELRLEAFDKKTHKKSAQTVEYRNELLKMINEKKERDARLYQEEVEMHQQLMKDIALEKANEVSAVKEKKRAFYQATMDFIKFAKYVHQLGEEHQQLCNNRIDELQRIDVCTKRNILRERQRKARIAEECFAALRQQICEQHKIRRQEEAEYRECKIVENRFIHKVVTRAEVLAAQQKFRQELDKQIEKLKEIRHTEESKFSHDLQRASNDPLLCDALAEKYIQEGVDYLKPHPNWRILDNNADECVAKSSAKRLTDIQCQGAIPKNKPHKNAGDGRGDENSH